MSGPGNCGCLACRAPGLFDRPLRRYGRGHNGKHWVVCPPCYDHLEEHFHEPDSSWKEGVGLTHNKEECLLEGTGCVACGKSHRAILEEPTTPPKNPCDMDYMEDISS